MQQLLTESAADLLSITAFKQSGGLSMPPGMHPGINQIVVAMWTKFNKDHAVLIRDALDTLHGLLTPIMPDAAVKLAFLAAEVLTSSGEVPDIVSSFFDNPEEVTQILR
eukprot:12573125-Alexandrium_andersonii.AAC.1